MDWPREELANLNPVRLGATSAFSVAQFLERLDVEDRRDVLHRPVSIGAIRAASRLHPGLTVLQIDAHGDTRESYEGSRFNHACVMRRLPCSPHGAWPSSRAVTALR